MLSSAFGTEGIQPISQIITLISFDFFQLYGHFAVIARSHLDYYPTVACYPIETVILDSLGHRKVLVK